MQLERKMLYYGGYGGCYLKKFITYDGDIVFKKVCY